MDMQFIDENNALVSLERENKKEQKPNVLLYAGLAALAIVGVWFVSRRK